MSPSSIPLGRAEPATPTPMNCKPLRLPVLLTAALLATPLSAQNTPGEVLSHQKLSALDGGLTATLLDGDQFGDAIANVGDLDGNGAEDVVIGAPGDDDGGPSRGAVWVVFLNTDGTAFASQKISDLEGLFDGELDDLDRFGKSVAGLGDLDGDGLVEVAVGAPGDDDGGTGRGAIYVLSLEANGIVASFTKISTTSGGYSGGLDNNDAFGSAVASIGDVDGDSVPDVAVGTPGDDDGGSSRGAVWILFLNTTGTVKAQQKISDIVGAFGGMLDDFDQLGNAVAGIGDLDGDGTEDLVAGAFGDDDGGPSHGAFWVLFLNPDGTVDGFQKVSSTQGGFGGQLDNGDAFAFSLASIGDVDGNELTDLAVGVLRDDDGGGPQRGAVWICYLRGDGVVKGEAKISDTAGNFTAGLDDFDQFGSAVAPLSDLDGDGSVDLIVGARNDDDGGTDRGAAYALFLEGRFQASVVTRNGAGTNPMCVQTVTMPVLNSDWTVLSLATGNAALIGQEAPLDPGVNLSFGELLVDVFTPNVFVAMNTGTSFTVSVPNDPNLVGAAIFVQGVDFGPPLALCNALDIVLGY